MRGARWGRGTIKLMRDTRACAPATHQHTSAPAQRPNGQCHRMMVPSPRRPSLRGTKGHKGSAIKRRGRSLGHQAMHQLTCHQARYEGVYIACASTLKPPLSPTHPNKPLSTHTHTQWHKGQHARPTP